MAAKRKRKAKTFRRREDAERRFRSILAAVKAIREMPEIVLEPHKKRMLKSCLWQLTQSEGWGKYNLRFATIAAEKLFRAGKRKELRHEHVYTCKRMIKDLLNASSDQIEEILKKACGCLVTNEEHQRLCTFDAESDGWERYKRARIEVYDRFKGQLVPIQELITCEEQR
jgi:hypothetical protein